MQTAPQILEAACEWRADAVADTSTWAEVLDERELEEIDAALRRALAKSDDVLDITRDDFPLPTVSGRLKEIESELINGRGFVC